MRCRTPGQAARAPTIARLRCFSRIDTLSACGIAAEIGEFTRFSRPDRLSGFLGILPPSTPPGSASGTGAITKAGPSHARVLAALAALERLADPRAMAVLVGGLDEQAARVAAVAWRCQQRLHGRWRHLLLQRGKPAGVVTGSFGGCRMRRQRVLADPARLLVDLRGATLLLSDDRGESWSQLSLRLRDVIDLRHRAA